MWPMSLKKTVIDNSTVAKRQIQMLHLLSLKQPDDEPDPEERDHFLQQLYKFMEDRGNACTSPVELQSLWGKKIKWGLTIFLGVATCHISWWMSFIVSMCVCVASKVQ